MLVLLLRGLGAGTQQVLQQLGSQLRQDALGVLFLDAETLPLHRLAAQVNAQIHGRARGAAAVGMGLAVVIAGVAHCCLLVICGA